MKKLVPLGSLVLVRLDPVVKKIGAIHLPDNGTEKSARGKVREVGTDVRDLKRGDGVILPKYGGHTIRIDDDECTIIPEKDILGKFVDE